MEVDVQPKHQRSFSAEVPNIRCVPKRAVLPIREPETLMPFSRVSVPSFKLGIGQNDPDIYVSGVRQLKRRPNKPDRTPEAEGDLASPRQETLSKLDDGWRVDQAAV